MSQNVSDRMRELEESAEGVELWTTPGGDLQFEEAREEAKGADPYVAPEPAPSGHPRLSRAIERRIELREAMADLERSTARSVDSPEWLPVVAASVERLGVALESHASEVEGEDGLLDQIRNDSPRLTSEIVEIEKEHVVLAKAASSLNRAVESGDFETIRRRVTSLLGRITLHRQRGADLVYEAFSVDIGASG